LGKVPTLMRDVLKDSSATTAPKPENRLKKPKIGIK
jgi:hypothetical protein